MKITCQSCQAKYTIADEKVAGKTVKIKCKKCGATIVVSGSDGAGQGPIASSGAAGAPLAAPPGDDDEGDGATRVFTEGVPGGGNDEWTVNVTDEDQRTLTAAQILYEYQRGVVTDDTYMWKDGMADWLPLSGVPELMRLVAGRGSAPAPRPAAGMPVAAPAPVAAAIPAMPPGGLGGTMMMTEPAASPFAAASPAAVAASAAAPPAAARRSGKAAGVDLFAPGQQQQEVAPAAASAGSSADRHVGERNENSVLFSISALTASAGAGKHNDDPFDLGAPAPRNGRGNVDDIMNLGGGMATGPMLAPPPLLAPVVEAPPPPPAPVMQQQVAAMAPMSVGAQSMRGGPMTPDYPQPKSKTPLILGLVGAVVVLGGAGAFFATRGGSTPGGSPDATTTAITAATTPLAVTVAAQTAAATPAPTGAAGNPGKPVVGGPLTRPDPKAPDPKPEPKAADPKPEPKAPDPKPAEPAAGGKDFDRAAASAALGAASGAARGCKKDDGPTGTARVKVTFAPSGSVTSASVDGPPFAGTAVGGCIAGAFRGAHIPAFDGSPVSVSKSVSIN